MTKFDPTKAAVAVEAINDSVYVSPWVQMDDIGNRCRRDHKNCGYEIKEPQFALFRGYNDNRFNDIDSIQDVANECVVGLTK